MTDLPEILIEAIEAAGGIKTLARALGINHQAFYSWKEIPPGRVIAIEKITGIPRSRLRPDLYPVEAAE